MADDNPNLADETEQDLSSLSPFHILKEDKNPIPPAQPPAAPAASTPPVQPVPVQPVPLHPNPPLPSPAQSGTLNPPATEKPPVRLPVAEDAAVPVPSQEEKPVPSKEELLKQAAEAPDVVFDVPEHLIIPTQPDKKPEDPQPKVHENPEVSSQNLPPVPTKFPQPAQTPPQPTHPHPNFQASHPEKLPPYPPKQAAPLVPEKKGPGVPVVPVPSVKDIGSQRSKSPLIGIIMGVLVLVLILAGGLAALAYNGVRVPVAYTMISGLPVDGAKVAAKAQTYLQTKATRSFTGNIEVKSTGQSNSAPSLPSLSGETQTIATIHQITADIKEAEESRTSVGRVSLAVKPVGASSAMSFISDVTTPDSVWTVNIPANTTEPVVGVSSSDIHKTLLFPALRPLGIVEILKGVQSVNGYESSRQSATYSYRLNMGSLPNVLPIGSTLKSAEAAITYAWSSAQPRNAVVTVDFLYLGVTYRYTENWNASNTPTATDTWSVLQVAQTGTPQQMSNEDFAVQMGIPSLASLPNDISGTATTPTPGNTPTPSPSPSPSSSAATTPINPSGQGITSVQEGILQMPSVPTTPASTEAKNRDAQRKRDLADLQNALERYKKNTGAYPISVGIEQTLQSSTLLKALVPSYITRLPVDPQPHTYWYEYKSNGTTFTIRSVAEDTADALAHAGTVYSYFEFQNN